MHVDFFEIGIRELATVRRGQLLYCNAFPIIVAFRNRAVSWQRCVGRSGLKNRRKPFPKMGFFAVFIKQKCDFILVGICRVGKINVLIGVHIRKVNFQRKNFGRNLSRRNLFPIDNRAFVMKFPQNLTSGYLLLRKKMKNP